MNVATHRRKAVVGIDTGGTFTDVIAVDGQGTLHLAKVASTNEDPGKAILGTIRDILPDWNIQPGDLGRLVHGTTVATNVVLEGKGARLGLLATEGFSDVIDIGRQNRRDLYKLALTPETPGHLVPSSLRRGVVEGISPTGLVDIELDMHSLEVAVEELVAEGVDAIAICFLFSYLNPTHEQAAARYIAERHPKIFVSMSSDVDPGPREYERTVTTVFDSYVKPALSDYLARVEKALASAENGTRFQIVQSRGGSCSAHLARQKPVQLFLSGPAAGVIGAQAAGREGGFENLITIDIGGTSSDIGLVREGVPVTRADGMLGDYRIRVPMVDVNAVGAGGGSIGWLDGAGSLRMGPESVGANPGPACYGRGSLPALTDACLVLGLLDGAEFAGGRVNLDVGLSRKAIAGLAEPMGISIEEAALGMLRVAHVQMTEGMRLVSLRRGYDPRSFALLAFGGGGPLHACALAEEMSIGTVIIPRYPGVLSALGCLSAQPEHRVTQSFKCNLDDLASSSILDSFARLDAECARLMFEEGIAEEATETQPFASVCYQGQAYYLEVPVTLGPDGLDRTRLEARFREDYRRRYGHAPNLRAMIVTIGVAKRATAGVGPVVSARAIPASSPKERSRRIWTKRTGGPVAARVLKRDDLSPGARIRGPALIEQLDTTTLVDKGWQALVTASGALVLTMETA